jgi:hypothetical protein
MPKAKVNYIIPAKNFRTLCYWAQGGVCSMAGKAYCRPEERKLVMDWARDLGLLPPDNFYRSIQAAGRSVPQIEATEKLASNTTECEQRRREMVSRSK